MLFLGKIFFISLYPFYILVSLPLCKTKTKNGNGILEQDRKFMGLLEPNLEKLWRFILSFIRDKDDAKDIMSDTMLAAYENFGRLESHEAFLSWLFTIARRFVYKVGKKRAEIFGSSHFELDDFKSGNLSPQEVSEMNDLYSALDKLPSEQKEAIVLTSIYGFSLAEAAGIQSTTPNTVKVRIYRAKQKLKELLGS
jgi:RNA polymerase sigma-70 factor (ECF subfamily)